MTMILSHDIDTQTRDTILELLDEADSICESDNLHDRIGLASDIFDRIECLVKKEDLLLLAKAAKFCATNY